MLTAVKKINKLCCSQGCGLVELVKLSVGYPKGPQFQSWCGPMVNISDQNSDLLQQLLVFIEEPDFPKLFLAQTSSIIGLKSYSAMIE
jgi:hypothetical protein